MEKRLGRILLDHNTQSLEEKIEIFTNACKNPSEYLSAACENIQRDIERDSYFQQVFNILPTDKIVSVKMLGEETHNKGQVPLLVELRSGIKIIYKPRSMRSEDLVCGHKDSLFLRLDQKKLTYRIHDKESYGYSEFLENIEEENHFETTEEVHQFFGQYHILEKFTHALGLSDLHQENILVSKKVPYIIDGEVIVPSGAPVYETGLLRGFTAGFLFTNETKNRIWFGEKVKDEFDEFDAEKLRTNDFGAMETLSMLSSLQIKPSLGYLETPLDEVEAEEVEKTLALLATQKHRIVIIDTVDLGKYIKDSLENSPDNFMHQLEIGIQDWGFKFDKQKEEEIRQCFIKDVKNNDVPVFYFQPSTNLIYYHGIPIAQRGELA